MMKIEIELYHTSKILPKDRQHVHWLVPRGKCWTSGYYHANSIFAPGFFQSLNGTLYICALDGHTWWTPELPIFPVPEGEEQ